MLCQLFPVVCHQLHGCLQCQTAIPQRQQTQRNTACIAKKKSINIWRISEALHAMVLPIPFGAYYIHENCKVTVAVLTSIWPNQDTCMKKRISSRQLRYPTYGKGTSSKVPLGRDMLVSKGVVPSCFGSDIHRFSDIHWLSIRLSEKLQLCLERLHLWPILVAAGFGSERQQQVPGVNNKKRVKRGLVPWF